MTNPCDIRSAEGTTIHAGPTASAQQSRIFVGLKIAPEIARQLTLLARSIEHVPLRLVPAPDIHLTLVPPWNEASIPDAVEKRNAFTKLSCVKSLLVVPGATHLFEEEGALDQVVQAAAEWFTLHLQRKPDDVICHF